MKRIAVSIILSFLLFSVAAETFSALFISNKDHIVLTDSEDNSKEDKKEKEESFKNKITGGFLEISCRDSYLLARVTPFAPDDANDTHKGFSSLPEQPPKAA